MLLKSVGVSRFDLMIEVGVTSIPVELTGGYKLAERTVDAMRTLGVSAAMIKKVRAAAARSYAAKHPNEAGDK